MIKSMTAYGRLENSGDWGETSCEIRTINHRYLEISLRLPEELRFLDQEIRQYIGKHLKRGKVDCYIRFTNTDTTENLLPINHNLLEKLIETAEAMAEKIRKPVNLNPLELLQWSGVMDKNIPDPEEVQKPILTLLEKTLIKVIDTREREGGKIRTMVLERCESAKQIVSNVNEAMPKIQNGVREKLIHRAQELTHNFSKERLEQELLLLAQKMDIAEEIDRLNVHISEVERVLDQTEPVGRRLDFLMQEMNRESNTLGSKSAHIDTTNASIGLKVIIEQIREQVQNIE